MKSQANDDRIWVSTSGVAEYFESDCWKLGANPFIQKRTCALQLGSMFCFYHQLHRKYNWKDVELNTFKPSFYKKFHIRIWELFFPHNGVVKNVHALHLFISPSSSSILCKRPVTLWQFKGDVGNAHEQKTLQVVGNSLSVPAITSWLLPCTSPLVWERWYLRARGCDREELR